MIFLDWCPADGGLILELIEEVSYEVNPTGPHAMLSSELTLDLNVQIREKQLVMISSEDGNVEAVS